MTVPFYYASTARQVKDIAQYAVYPVARAIARCYTPSESKAQAWAGLATTTFYSGLTNVFSGVEARAFDQITRKAARAELGMRDDEFHFSNYLDSKNAIISNHMEQWQHTYHLRSMTDMLPLLPVAVEYGAGVIPGMDHIKQYEKKWGGANVTNRPAPKSGFMDHLMYGHGIYDNAIFSGKAAYWVYETFALKKSGFYETYKISETKEEVKRKVTADDLIGVVNRTRSDMGLEMLREKYERNAMWPVLERLAQKMNDSEEFDLPEMVYLMGNGKINIFDKADDGEELKDKHGHRIISSDAIHKSMEEIDHVDEVGLEGICEENRKLRLEKNAEVPDTKTLVQKLNRTVLDTHFAVSNNVIGAFVEKGARTNTEYISPRDMGEVPHSVA